MSATIQKLKNKTTQETIYPITSKDAVIGISTYETKEEAEANLKEITDKIPEQATSENQLADKAFVNSSVQTATANFRGSWNNYDDVPTDSLYYPEDYSGSTIPTVNDYLVIEDASKYVRGFDHTITVNKLVNQGSIKITFNGNTTTHSITTGGDTIAVDGVTVFTVISSGSSRGIAAATPLSVDGVMYSVGQTVKIANWDTAWTEMTILFGGAALEGTWRFKYTGTWETSGKLGWLPEYQVNEEPFTTAQLAALNSGITSTAVTKLGTIAEGAEVNVQANWNTVDTTDDSYILNKPTTIAGYGITDANITDGTITLGANTLTPLTESEISDSEISTSKTWSSEKVSSSLVDIYRPCGSVATYSDLPGISTKNYNIITGDGSTIKFIVNPIWKNVDTGLASGLTLTVEPGDTTTTAYAWFRNAENWGRNSNTNLAIDGVTLADIGYTVDVTSFGKGVTVAHITFNRDVIMTTTTTITMDCVTWGAELVDGTQVTNGYTLTKQSYAIALIKNGSVYTVTSEGKSYEYVNGTWGVHAILKESVTDVLVDGESVVTDSVANIKTVFDDEIIDKTILEGTENKTTWYKTDTMRKAVLEEYTVSPDSEYLSTTDNLSFIVVKAFVADLTAITIDSAKSTGLSQCSVYVNKETVITAINTSTEEGATTEATKSDYSLHVGDVIQCGNATTNGFPLNGMRIYAKKIIGGSYIRSINGITSNDHALNIATVATSGSYTDLLNKPSIPTVYNGTLTIQKNGTKVLTFSANLSSSVTANITVPTAVSELTNDSNYATESYVDSKIGDINTILTEIIG